jgi:NodT family efflux transporter outer membrane factor (OMF) lipoprotein
MTNISRSTDGAAARRRAWTGLACACAGVLALTAGCAAVGPNFKAPATPTATSYAMAGDDAASPGPTQAAVGDQVAGAWWSLFKSPALDQLVREAIANNRTLEQARARLAASHEAVRAESGLLTADFSGGAYHERANLNAFSGGAFSASSLAGFPTNPIYNLYTISPSISYNLDLFGAKRRRVESLKATAEAQARELDAAYLILSGEVFEQALTVADANLQIRALEGIGANDQADLDMLRRAQAAGGATAADIAAAESQLAADQAAIPVQRQRLAVARHALATLVGKTSAEWSPPEFDETSGVLPASLPVSLPSQLVRNRPDILEAEAQLHAATADIGVADAAFYPDITLSATIAQSALTPQTLFSGIADSWAVGGGLTTPIFHSGQLKARKREAEAQARAALAAYEETVLEAFNQVDDALQAVAHDNDAYARQSQAVAAAEARLEMMRKAQAAGGASAQDVIRAERDWRRLKLILSQQGTSRFADAGRLLLTTAAVPPKG